MVYSLLEDYLLKYSLKTGQFKQKNLNKKKKKQFTYLSQFRSPFIDENLSDNVTTYWYKIIDN